MTQVFKNVRFFYFKNRQIFFLNPIKGVRLFFKHQISSFIPFLRGQFGLPGSGSADLIESGSNPDPKQGGIFVHILVCGGTFEDFLEKVPNSTADTM
jgi:hypothetical protein